MVMTALNTPYFAHIVGEAELVIPDGHGIIWGADKLTTPLKEQVPGIELFKELLKKANEKAYSIYLYGAKEEVIEKTIKNIEDEYPGIKILGYSHGYIGKDEEEELLKKLGNLPIDFLFVALGSPHQEYFIKECKNYMDHGVAIGVGGSFDVLSGTVKRAPKWVQKIHMEWLYRFLKNPSRLKRLFIIPKYMGKVRKQKKTTK